LSPYLHLLAWEARLQAGSGNENGDYERWIWKVREELELGEQTDNR